MTVVSEPSKLIVVLPMNPEKAGSGPCRNAKIFRQKGERLALEHVKTNAASSRSNVKQKTTFAIYETSYP